MKRIVIALAVAAVLVAGAVSVWNMTGDGSVATASGAEHVVPRDKVEEHAKEDFGRPFSGDAPDAVSCPRGLRAEMDDTVRCTAVFDGERKPMTVSVTGVDGDQVNLGFGVEKKSE
ncbi:DUF4333 domain-containing protein [Streptomyces pinistramenti]|uniref:DUF4333 domain-containing protein n=1 Tax=Streptomyces pinistramenti TaxID=2884812 RepID=UPI001D063F84|nr:DUF4333 domain-containing protein [Streptomyces pinistramenti]MCB5909151.1 DUF4333 domain-containing protein [Streptomyces pinistramenti]